MRIKIRMPEEMKAKLVKEYEEYVQKVPMNKKEKSALREWVQNGHSVYENELDALAEGGASVDFLTIYRNGQEFDLEYDGWSEEFILVSREANDNEGLSAGNDSDVDIPF